MKNSSSSHIIPSSLVLQENLSSIEEAFAILEPSGAARISKWIPIRGGDISTTSVIVLDTGRRLFVKQNRPHRTRMFQAEAQGLLALSRLTRESKGIRIPQPLAWGNNDSYSFLLMEEIKTGRLKSGPAFGAALARLHRTGRQENCGWSQDNWLGTSLQINRIRKSWHEFFVLQRLLPQWERARRTNRLNNGSQDKAFESILRRLPELLPPPDDGLPSLLHGDLWAGNWLTDKKGVPTLVDPAVYYGHREADLATTCLFGGFPKGFYEGYVNEWPIIPDFDSRVDLYNLYHLLNHLNLFGGSYMGSIRVIVHRYGVEFQKNPTLPVPPLPEPPQSLPTPPQSLL